MPGKKTQKNMEVPIWFPYIPALKESGSHYKYQYSMYSQLVVLINCHNMVLVWSFSIDLGII